VSSFLRPPGPRGFFAFGLLAFSSALDGPRLRVRVKGGVGGDGGGFLVFRGIVWDRVGSCEIVKGGQLVVWETRRVLEWDVVGVGMGSSRGGEMVVRAGKRLWWEASG